jgi:hypothetical protein
MLQQIFLSNPQVVAKPEPWLMLQLVYVYKKLDWNGGYNPLYGHIALNDYLTSTGAGIEFLKSKIRDCALELYSLSLKEGAIYVLDKTPRYYHIIDELVDLFPKAKFVLLARNPLSVFGSILNYNFNGNIKEMMSSPDRIHDLYTGPKNILKAKNRNLPNVVFIRYEDLVQDQGTIQTQIVNFLGIEYKSFGYSVGMDFASTSWVDSKSVAKHSAPVENYIDSWRDHIHDGGAKCEAISYLRSLGEELMSGLGYDFSRTIGSVIEHKVDGEYSYKFRRSCRMTARRALNVGRRYFT